MSAWWGGEAYPKRVSIPLAPIREHPRYASVLACDNCFGVGRAEPDDGCEMFDGICEPCHGEGILCKCCDLPYSICDNIFYSKDEAWA
jgi:hypothetical protein